MATVVITGANRGIGLAFARVFAERGEQVIGTARKPDEATELAALGRVLPLDVSDDASVAAFAERLSGESVDLLINNAGLLVLEDLRSANGASLLRQFDVNAVGPFRVTQALASNLRAAPAARVVNITSRMGSIQDNSSGKMYGYRASKAALNMINKSLSIDLAPVPVVLIHPGMVKTDMVGGRGELEPEEAVARMMVVIDRIDASMSGNFYHRDDYELPW